MSTPIDPRREYSNTYIVKDRSNQEELDRVRIQGEMITAGMGGPLPEQPDPTIFKTVIDIACGAGDWLLELAATYPTMTRLVGVDASSPMVNYARAQAAAHQYGERVTFKVMDALLIVEFPTATFDLVNIRFGSSFLRKWEWPKLLSEFRRVSSIDGMIRVTESDILQESTSPALLRVLQIILQATRQSGRTFDDESNGITESLVGLLIQHGFKDVKTRSYALEYRAGTPEWQSFYDDTSRAMHTLLPYLRKFTRLPDDYEQICKQALIEMRQPDFVATWKLLTAWAKPPVY